MKWLLGIIVFLIIVNRPIYASYHEAYQDYLIQFDLYRQKYTEFQIAKNEYKKFKTLTSQATALDKTKTMLWQRDMFLRSYLLMLQEKINDENSGLQSNLKQQYQTLISNEIGFLETQSAKISSIGSIDDAIDLSNELESHYMVLQTTIRQILIGLSLGQLEIAAQHFDALVIQAKSIVQENQNAFDLGKQETIRRWLLQIDSKRSFYQQKFDSITVTNALLKSRDPNDLDKKFNDLVRNVAEARQYLVEGVSFIAEVRDQMKFAN